MNKKFQTTNYGLLLYSKVKNLVQKHATTNTYNGGANEHIHSETHYPWHGILSMHVPVLHLWGRCPLTLILPRTYRLLHFSSASNLKILKSNSRLMKMLSECQTAWIRVRRRVTLRFIRIQAVCMWEYGLDLQDKGLLLNISFMGYKKVSTEAHRRIYNTVVIANNAKEDWQQLL